MIDSLAYILADTETDYTKVIFGAVFFLIWIVSAIVSTIAKKQEEQRRKRVREQLERSGELPAAPGQVAVPPPLPQRPQPQAPRPQRPSPPPRPVVVKQPPKKFPVKQPTRRVSRPAPETLEAQAHTPASRIAAAAPAPSPAKRPTVGASATAISSWLRPATLRQQFILTEVFQPPVAMRQQHLQ